jgi:hypothetical protein
MDRDRDPCRSADRVCAHCGGILRPHPSPAAPLLHVRANGVFYVTGHRPVPRETVDPT